MRGARQAVVFAAVAVSLAVGSPANAVPDRNPTAVIAYCLNIDPAATRFQLVPPSEVRNSPLLVPPIHCWLLVGVSAAEKKRRRSKPVCDAVICV